MNKAVGYGRNAMTTIIKDNYPRGVWVAIFCMCVRGFLLKRQTSRFDLSGETSKAGPLAEENRSNASYAGSGEIDWKNCSS